MLPVDKIRKDFPILRIKVNGKPLIYLDSAATSQRPDQVIDAVSGFYSTKNANVARALHSLAEQATEEYEAVRDKVRAFINAREREEIIFTKNTTESANLVMRGWGGKFIRKGDKIVVTVMEHHSNFVPWQQLAREKGARFEVVDIGDDGMLDMADLEKKLKGARLLSFSAASNVLGTVTEAKKICAMARDAGAVSVVDGAQSVPSLPTDVRRLGCDFLMFSGHKMLAPFGVGVLHGRRELLEGMAPFIYGSKMIRKVTTNRTEFNELPDKFESGTPDVAAVIGLGAALDYLNRLGMDRVAGHERSMAAYMLGQLSQVKGLRVLGPPDARKRVGLVAFTLEGLHPHDISAILDDDGIAVRSGHHCAMPLHHRLRIPASTRASAYIYNKKEEIDALVESLGRARKMFS